MSLRRPTAACSLFLLFISPLCGVAKTPDCGMLVISFIYKPFRWCRSDARLRHVFYKNPFEASLQTPDRCNLFLLPYCIFVLYINNPACVHHGLLFYDWRCDHRIFQSMITICYVIPVFIMFASTFKSTHWLVPGYCLGQISCMEKSVAMTAPEPMQRW